MIRPRMCPPGVGCTRPVLEQALPVPARDSACQPVIEFDCPALRWCTFSKGGVRVPERVNRIAAADHEDALVPEWRDRLTQLQVMMWV
jgi:hypothetical protein